MIELLVIAELEELKLFMKTVLIVRAIRSNRENIQRYSMTIMTSISCNCYRVNGNQK